MRQAVKAHLPAFERCRSGCVSAPFPDVSYKAGVRRFPQLVPDRLDAPGAALSRQARDWWRRAWQGRTFMAIGMKDPVLGPLSCKRCARKSRVPAAARSGRCWPFRPGVGGERRPRHAESVAHFVA